ncbi:MAG TPA: hypothetical protein VJ913_06865 [Actinomycetota bacterium]|nr:hypothetical protein [Actinomycetota bacterium]
MQLLLVVQELHHLELCERDGQFREGLREPAAQDPVDPALRIDEQAR